MKILFQHSHPLPVKKYGGTERILFWLMKELVRLGHSVHLIGHPDCQLQGTGIQLIKQSGTDFRAQIPAGVDLIHLFYAPPYPLPAPTLVTIEGNGQIGENFPLNTVFVSQKHAQNHGANHFVYNGLDLDEYPYQGPVKISSWQNFLFLAKASWKVKNLKGCVEAAQASGKHLHIAGGRHWTLSRLIHSYGMIDQKKKRQLLPKMHALLFPVRWHEPFGIAVIEAYASGLPVIGSPYGSLPELIPDFAGHIVSDQSELIAVMKNAPRVFESERIRHYVETQFAVAKMAQDYLHYYERVRSGEDLHTTAPTWKLTQTATDMLFF